MGNLPKYEVELKSNSAFLFASVKGETEANGPAGYLNRIAEHCIRSRCSSILIEKHTHETLSIWDTFAVAPKLARIGRAVIRIAFVEKGAAPPRARKLSVMIGRDTGVMVQIFTDTGKAKAWLHDCDGPSAIRAVPAF
ncbi:MAG: hypothetical protein ABJB40_08605 [Acidobacteriota bacterium]